MCQCLLITDMLGSMPDNICGILTTQTCVILPVRNRAQRS